MNVTDQAEPDEGSWSFSAADAASTGDAVAALLGHESERSGAAALDVAVAPGGRFADAVTERAYQTHMAKASAPATLFLLRFTTIWVAGAAGVHYLSDRVDFAVMGVVIALLLVVLERAFVRCTPPLQRLVAVMGMLLCSAVMIVARIIDDNATPSWLIIVAFSHWTLVPCLAPRASGSAMALVIVAMVATQTQYAPEKTAQNLVGFAVVALVASMVVLETRQRDRFFRSAFVTRHELKVSELVLKAETVRARQLLRNIFPDELARDMAARGAALDAEAATYSAAYPDCTVLVADLAGFTRLSAGLTPEDLVQFMQKLFVHIDHIADDYGLTLIKRIGDAVVLATCPMPLVDGAACACAAGLLMVAQTDAIAGAAGYDIKLRCGIDLGMVHCGVVGVHRRLFDIHGPAVTTAFALEAQSTPGCVHVSQAVASAAMQAAGAPFVLKPSGVSGQEGAGGTFFVSRSGRAPRYRALQSSDLEVAKLLDAIGFAHDALPRRLLQRRNASVHETEVDNEDEESIVARNADRYRRRTTALTMEFVEADVEEAYLVCVASEGARHTAVVLAHLFVAVALFAVTDETLVRGSPDVRGVEVHATRFALIVSVVAGAMAVAGLGRRLGRRLRLAAVRGLIFGALILTVARALYFASQSSMAQNAAWWLTGDYPVILVALVAMSWVSVSVRFATLAMLAAMVIFSASQIVGGEAMGTVVIFGPMYTAAFLLALRAQEAARRARFSDLHVLAAHSASLEGKLALVRNLALTALPPFVYERLIVAPKSFVAAYERAVVGFVSVVDFEARATALDPRATIELLGRLYERFEHDLHAFPGLVKIKANLNGTYMFAACLTADTVDAAAHRDGCRQAVLYGFSLIEAARAVGVEVAAGIATGPTMGGVVGTTRLAFDIFSDATNTAARLMQTAAPSTLQISMGTRDAAAGEDDAGIRLTTTSRTVPLKGKGDTEVCVVDDVARVSGHPFAVGKDN